MPYTPECAMSWFQYWDALRTGRRFTDKSLPEDVLICCAIALPALKEATWASLLHRQLSWVTSVREQASLRSIWDALFAPTTGEVDYAQWQDPTCGARLINAALNNLVATDDPTITTRRLKAAGEVLLGYRGVGGRPLLLPYQDPVQADEIRDRSAQAVRRLSDVNPTLAVEYLTRALEQGENDSPTVGTIIRGIGAIIEKHGDYVDTALRNRAITVVGSISALGAQVYGPFAPKDAAVIYERIKKWLGTPLPMQLYATAPPAKAEPTASDFIALQKAVNRVARRYGISAVPVTAVLDEPTRDAVVRLAKRFTASPGASSIYSTVVSSPTSATVADLAPRIAHDLSMLADQLALSATGEPTGARSFLKPILLGSGIAVAAAGMLLLASGVFASQQRRESPPRRRRRPSRPSLNAAPQLLY